MLNNRCENVCAQVSSKDFNPLGHFVCCCWLYRNFQLIQVCRDQRYVSWKMLKLNSPTKFSVLWDSKFSMENCDTPSLPLLIHKIFRYPKFSETLKGSPRNFSALWDKKISTENSDIPFLCIQFFDTRKFLKHQSVPQGNFSVLRQKILNEVFCI